MSIPAHIFKSYDIRGIVPDEINKENIYGIAQAVLGYIQRKLGKTNITIAVGKDMRLSAPTLYPIFKKALVDGGATIIDNGLVSTPTFYFSVLHLRTDAGIQLTASHNPPQYSGMKMVIRDGDGLVKIGKGTGMDEIQKSALEGIVIKEKGGSEKKHEGIMDEEIKYACELVSMDGIKALKVVADPANAMGITYIDALFKKLPCELVKMNFELDGTFPSHEPNPLVFENLRDLQKKVIEEKADLGIAPDGDGDRMFFIDEKGQIIQASYITAIVSRELLRRFPGEKILFDIRYIMTPKKIIEELGGSWDITKVGHAFITQKIHETNALFGGESSAHYFFRYTGGAESQLLMILLILKIMSKSGKKLSELVEEVKRSSESGEINFVTDNAQDILNVLKETYHDAEISMLDGISIEYPDWRCNVRTSNTEPLLRLNLEAINDVAVKKRVKEVTSLILKQGARIH
ncbi:hypothetical protein A3D06_00750 [Candidatus Roizmanbacteria bacterium RIFCSPHIGHO2_02_FULL_40_9]|uniref:Phosphomannomutase/phosphoglucomutase n=2 Tax=Candidatus Roizmaniibacteriota TaxID=1752723 RepID=A0A1F7IKE4_9BACT|nr:MAG: hypothetical protein A3D06_00750 [Candidatus Roizmanbacteria bacterium RIFCSPHIGHO2_02_FULL_40_9]OGK43819.1 MAG: hypothetical protein A2957_02500 [Candidatus Roizmanbacteria bacterium RIFCSPLOWO2_01_FULL_38_11]